LLRIFLICFVLVFASYLANLWIGSYRILPSKKEDVGILEGINIKVFGKKGVEWHVKGGKARLENSKVLMEQVEFQSEDTLLVADKALVDRITGEGFLEGNVKLYTKEGMLATNRAEVKLKEGIAHGDGHIIFKNENSIVQGVGWNLQVKPLRVIIRNAKVRLE